MKAWTRNEDGFTLTELLVVMLILGALAALAIPAFLSQRAKASDAEARGHARTAQTAAETFATEGNGAYSGISAEGLMDIEPTLADAEGRLSVEEIEDGRGYEITVTSAGTDNAFTVERSADGQMSFTCTVGGQGGCSKDGTWGG